MIYDASKLTLVKELRKLTQVGLQECKKALEACGFSIADAVEYIKANNIRSYISTKPFGAGIVCSYVHHNQKAGSLVVLECNTDFVAKNEEFQELGKRLALQVAGFGPANVEELLKQPSLKNNEITVEDEIKELSSKMNENIAVTRFQRYSI